MTFRRLKISLLVLFLFCSDVCHSSAQNEVDLALVGVSALELQAWQAVQERPIRARKLATEALAQSKQPFVAHLVLGHVFHFAEANFPRALFHLNKAKTSFEARFGSTKMQDPWRWYAQILLQLAMTHSALEHFAEQLHYIDAYNKRYDPDMLAQKAWPLMKLRKFDAARRAAQAGLATNRADQQSVALNALCGLEFEAGNDERSYRYCKQALEYGEERFGSPTAVDYTNFAEASRAVFALDEAEKYTLAATKAPVSWYSNPWMELAELYTRQARFTEAVSALKQIGAYRMQRPPHTRYIDQAEVLRASAELLLIAGDGVGAAEVAGRAVLAPDRRAHASRDPRQDQLVVLLLQRRGLLVAAAQQLEVASMSSWWLKPRFWWHGFWHGLQAWYVGRKAIKILEQDSQMIGVFRVGSASSSVMPPWIAGDVIDLVGATQTERAILQARQRDKRRKADAYYAAFLTESYAKAGAASRVIASGRKALDILPKSEVLLRLRTKAIIASTLHRAHRYAEAYPFFLDVVSQDPGVLRRLDISLPVITSPYSWFAVGERVDATLMNTKRLEHTTAATHSSLALNVREQANGQQVQVSLSDATGQIISRCDNKDRTMDIRRISTQCLKKIFSPRVDFQALDVNSLDAGNIGKRGGLEELLR